MPRSTHTRDYRLFREYLRSVRRQAGLTQKEVAKALGVHQSYVSKYETGERRLDVVELRRICRALKVPLGAFITRLDKRLSRN